MDRTHPIKPEIDRILADIPHVILVAGLILLAFC